MSDPNSSPAHACLPPALACAALARGLDPADHAFFDLARREAPLRQRAAANRDPGALDGTRVAGDERMPPLEGLAVGEPAIRAGCRQPVQPLRAAPGRASRNRARASRGPRSACSGSARRSSKRHATSVYTTSPVAASSNFLRQQRPQPSQSDSHSSGVISVSFLRSQNGCTVTIALKLPATSAIAYAPKQSPRYFATLGRTLGPIEARERSLNAADHVRLCRSPSRTSLLAGMTMTAPAPPAAMSAAMRSARRSGCARRLPVRAAAQRRAVASAERVRGAVAIRPSVRTTGLRRTIVRNRRSVEPPTGEPP